MTYPLVVGHPFAGGPSACLTCLAPFRMQTTWKESLPPSLCVTWPDLALPWGFPCASLAEPDWGQQNGGDVTTNPGTSKKLGERLLVGPVINTLYTSFWSNGSEPGGNLHCIYRYILYNRYQSTIRKHIRLIFPLRDFWGEFYASSTLNIGWPKGTKTGDSRHVSS